MKAYLDKKNIKARPQDILHAQTYTEPNSLQSRWLDDNDNVDDDKKPQSFLSHQSEQAIKSTG